MNTRSMNARGFLAAGLIATLSGGALALSPQNTNKSDTQQVNLGGPKVENAGSPEQGTQGQAEREGPRLMEYMMGVRSLRNAGGELTITAEQREAIGNIVREHRTAMAAFLEENKEEIDELRKQAGLPERDDRSGLQRRGQRGGQRGAERPQPENEMDQPGQTGRSDDDSTTGRQGRARPEPPTPEQQEARDLLRELMAKGPDESAAVKAIESLLSADQIESVHAAITENKERRQEGARDRRQRGPQNSDRVRGQRQRTSDKQDTSDG
ncbi:MAG: hypothetical protein AAGA55_12785 [Planctomycetota bacterium]